MSIPRFITPTGMSIRDEVDLIYMLLSSWKGICAKLDADVLVTDTNYTALCYTAIFNLAISDSRGNSLINKITGRDNDFNIISPNGITDKARNDLVGQICTFMSTFMTKADADLGTTWKATYYDTMPYGVTNWKGTHYGGSHEQSSPMGFYNQRDWVDMLAGAVHALQHTTEDLDASANVTDTNYKALWFTANILIKITDSTGHTYGNN